MNRLSLQKRAQILHFLVEGNSMRATSRMADVSINTVTKLLVDVGYACSQYQDKALINLPCKGLAGDIWTWTALDPDSKLMVSWLVGDRDVRAATRLMRIFCRHIHNGIRMF